MDRVKKLTIEKIILMIVCIVPFMGIGIWLITLASAVCVIIGLLELLFSFFLAILGWFSVSLKEYNYLGKNIIVYCGAFHHYLEVEGEIIDEHNTISSFTPIVLSGTDKDGAVYNATISLTARITLKIDNKLYDGKYLA